MHAHELTVPDRQIHFIAAAHSLSRKRPSADDTSCDAEPKPRHWKSAAGRVQPTPGRKDQHALTWIRAKRRSSLGERTNGPPHPAPATASRRLPLPFPGVAQRWIPPPRIIVQIRRPPHPPPRRGAQVHAAFPCPRPHGSRRATNGPRRVSVAAGAIIGRPPLLTKLWNASPQVISSPPSCLACASE